MKRPVGGRQVLVQTPLQLLRKLAAVTPPPGKHLVHFHGVFAPHARHRAQVVALGRPAASVAPTPEQAELPLAEERVRPRRPRLDWASLLRKTFAIDVLRCPRCGGRRAVLAAVTGQEDIVRVLASRGLSEAQAPPRIPSQAPPAQSAFAFAA